MTSPFATMAEVRAFNMGVDLMLRIMNAAAEQVVAREPKLPCSELIAEMLVQLVHEGRKALVVPGVDDRRSP